MPRQPAPLAPRRFQLARAANRGPFVARDDGQKALESHDADARQMSDRAFVDRDERSPDGRRPDDTRMEHARQSEVLNVWVTPRALGGHIRPRRRLPDAGIARRLDERGFRVHRQREAAAASPADQRADADPAPTGHGPHFARDDREIGDRTLQPGGAEPEQRMSRGRRRLSNRRASSREPGAPASTARVRAARGIAVDDGHPSRIDAEFLRRHLGDRDAHAGSDVHLARVDRYRTVGVDRKKAVDFSGIEGPAITALRTRRRHLLAERRQPAEREADDEASGRLQPVSSVDVVTQRSRHVRWDLKRNGRSRERTTLNLHTSC